MYRINILLVFFIVIQSCKGQLDQKNEGDSAKTEVSYVAFGEKVDDSKAFGSHTMLEKYQVLIPSDTLSAKFNAKVLEVCQAKGCWMRLQLSEGQEAMVKFKDYGFFVPTDIAGKEVIVKGGAFVNEMSIAEQQHYAKDAGKSDGEIAKITEPKKTYGFLADGVLLKQ